MRVLRSIGLIAAAGLLGLLPAAAQGQKPPTDKKQEESLADAARRLRAQRQSAAQVKRVWTNDNLPPERSIAPAPESSEGAEAGESAGAEGATETGAAEGAAAPAVAGGSPTTSEKDEAERAKAEAAVQEAKGQLGQLQGDLSLLERDYNLAREQFYSNPDYANDAAGQSRLNAQQGQIDAKKTEIAASEARVKELEQELAAVNQRLGPRAQAPTSPSQWGERLRPLQAELAQVESQIQSLRGQISSTPGISPGAGNDYTRNQIATLEAKRDDLRRRIGEIQDEARRTGAPPAWTRPPL